MEQSCTLSELYLKHHVLVCSLCYRALPPAEYLSTSINLTGDKQTDADIQAFIRARHNLLNSTGIIYTHSLSLTPTHTHTHSGHKWKET